MVAATTASVKGTSVVLVDRQASARSAMDVTTPPCVRRQSSKLSDYPTRSNHQQTLIQMLLHTSQLQLLAQPLHYAHVGKKLCCCKRPVPHNPSPPHISIGVRFLLDSGSQRSYITEEARRLLKLEPSREQLLEIATFGASDGQRKVCEIVNVGMNLKGYSRCPCPCMLSQQYATH